jgi:uncharacterized protein YbaR (Trm112 family)
VGIRYEDKLVEGKTYQGAWVPCVQSVRETFGPCLVCGNETKYAGRNLDEQWLGKQFKRREKLLTKLRGLGYQNESPSVQYIEMIVCPTCREECKVARDTENRRQIAEEEAREAEKAARREQKKREAEQRKYHLTWREAAAGEFDPSKHSAEFRVSLHNLRPYVVSFRWRATGGKCRGDSPRNVVGMWVNGKLVAHYEAWDLEPFWIEEASQDYQDWYSGADDDNDEAEYRSDVFAPGFREWIEREFQDRLLQLKPSATWRTGGSWPLNTYSLNGLQKPCVIHTQWIDDSIYAALFCDKDDMDLPRLSEFVARYLGLRIEQPSFKPLVKMSKKRRVVAYKTTHV